MMIFSGIKHKIWKLALFLHVLLLQHKINGQNHSTKDQTHCLEYFKNINLSCYCYKDNENGTHIDCNGITFPREFPILPYRHNILSFSQSNSGLQSLEAQLFTASNIPLQKINFSKNRLRRLTERTFEGIEDTLKELDLSYNKLGDQLNFIFSSEEFHKLVLLEKLDLSRNEIKQIQSRIFDGLISLQELNLEENELISVPSLAFQGLQALKYLHLQKNYISLISGDSFPSLPALLLLNLSSNDLTTIPSNAFINLPSLKILLLANNQIHSLSSESLFGLSHLEHLDLTQNFLEALPASLFSHSTLKKLILHANKIKSLAQVNLSELQYLEYIDLRRNRIFEIAPHSFSAMKNLKEIHLDVNTIRKVTNEMFIGLEGLSDLTLNDNRILAFPTEPLNMFKNLRKLSLDYNRIAVISKEIVSPVKKNEELSLAFNLISEIPDGTFVEFQNLLLLNLHGNKIKDFSKQKTKGIENTLLYLDIGYNEITYLPSLQFSQLLILSLAKNRISNLTSTTFDNLTSLKYLNLSYNLLSELPPNVFSYLKNLESLDIGHNLINYLPSGIFKNLSVVHLNFRHNQLVEIPSFAFENLENLHSIDLSSNNIKNIASNAFYNLHNIQSLNLENNKLLEFRSEIFSVETKIHTLILSYNDISFLTSDSFIVHPKLQSLDLSFNNLTVFPSLMLKGLNFLKEVNLKGNKLILINDGHFSNMPNLKQVILEQNLITHVGEFAFQNSSNLHILSLKNNKIQSLPKNAFVSLYRLDLDISFNNLSNLPSEIFLRSNGLKLESLNLAMNNFKDFPIEALKKQYSFLEKLNISYNKLNNLPSNADVLVNIKELDLSYNPLSTDAHHVLFAEPKSIRMLYVQGVGISSLPTIESPFMRYLNLNGNKLSNIVGTAFQRTNGIVDLNLSQNEIPNLNKNLALVWSKLQNLRKLDVSNNPIRYIEKSDFIPLEHLRELNINNLMYATEINCESFRTLPRLRKLEMHGYNSLPLIHIKHCLRNISGLEHLGIEIKDAYLNDQLHAIFSPKLNTLAVSGKNLRSVSSSAFAGMLSSLIKISLTDTSVDTFTDKIFLPFPLSSKIEFTISNNKIQHLTQEMLSILDNKQVDIVFIGLNLNPLVCDCHMTYFWSWIQDKLSNSANIHFDFPLHELTCSKPENLKNKKIKDLPSNLLVCEEFSTSTTLSSSETSLSTVIKESTSQENPYIIFEPPVTKKPLLPPSYVPTTGSRSTLTKVDTMIIGIVAGVVAFVCILIIIICIVRLRRAHPLYTAGPLAGPLAFRAQGKCTCLKPPPNNCTCYPMYPMSYPCVGHASSLPSSSPHRKMLPPSLPPVPGAMHTSSRSGRLRNAPYYVTYPESENENK